MDNTYFKMIGQRTSGKVILMAVVDEEFLNIDNLPNIFEFQCIKMSPTIYTGTYPTIKINTETLTDRNDLKGMGAAGILTKEQWYCVNKKQKDLLGISL